QVLAGFHATVVDQPVVDDARQVVDVRVGTVEQLGGLFLVHQGTAETGADGVDEDQVGEVQPGAGVVFQRGRIGGGVALVAEFHRLRADGAEVEVHRGRAGTTVECERHRAVFAGDG